jgi:phage terminase small subunit
MNDKQKKFAKEYLTDMNATQAAIRSGYSKKNSIFTRSAVVEEC